ncbi:MAG: LLM class flavin-dependent oxidoreductase [Gammaproteobacteria bacterium]|nr:LLM class flavin-dependent oxidoreductase [Gammaproteobacteria bacterium]MCP4927435.1 LLM class flavin-dependent oxidoreductase [Gammaproteobacteria bacterium]
MPGGTPLDIDIILEPDVTPSQVAELAIEAERLGIRALWSSNYHQHWDSFLSLAPAAAVTSKIILGPLAVSPWEIHPLKMANALLTLNEMSNGRAMVAVSGGGGILGAIGWRAETGGTVWPGHHPIKKTRYPDRRVRGVRECLEILIQARSGKFASGYDGGTFVISRPFVMNWAESSDPLIYSCSSGPQMIRMGARIADGIQVSDFTVDMLAEAKTNIDIGQAKRSLPPADFRFGNFWAWHIKEDREASMYEARRELIWRGAVIGKEKEILMKFLHDTTELNIVMENWDNFRKACWTRSGNIEGVPEDLVNRLIAGLSSAGNMNDLDAELERFQQMKAGGLTELSLRLHDDPMDALQLIGQHVLPALQ